MSRFFVLLFSLLALTASAGTRNIAPAARATASSCAPGSSAGGVNDGVARIAGKGEWASDVSYANQPGLSTAHVFSHAGKPWLTQYWVRRVKEQAYGAVSPSRGYGGHDEDQGQMSGVSALMAIGLFSVNGGSDINPSYEITSPVFDEVTIRLDNEYYPGSEFRIVTHGNSAENCYIDHAELNGKPYNSFLLPHDVYAKGGKLELWLSDKPNIDWGIDK